MGFETQTRCKSGGCRNPFRVWRAAMVWARVELSARRAPRCRMPSPQWPTRCFTKSLTGSIFLPIPFLARFKPFDSGVVRQKLHLVDRGLVQPAQALRLWWPSGQNC